jgi:transcriptional regulator with XRE-family HTH domain
MSWRTSARRKHGKIKPTGIIGRRVYDFRILNDLTIVDLAELSDLHPKTIGAIECKGKANGKSMAKVANVMGLTLHQLKSASDAKINEIERKNLTPIARDHSATVAPTKRIDPDFITLASLPPSVRTSLEREAFKNAVDAISKVALRFYELDEPARREVLDYMKFKGSRVTE